MSETTLGPDYQENNDPGAPRTFLGNPMIGRCIAVCAALLASFATLSCGLPAARAAMQDPAAQDEPDAEKQDADKEAKKSPFAKDVRNVKEYELPESQLKEILKGSRPHRRQDPALLVEVVLDPPAPTTQELRRFNDELRKQTDIKKEEDLALIDKVVYRQVASLSQPRKDWYLPSSEGRKSRDAIATMLDTGGGASERFMVLYKQALIQRLPELLDKNLWVRVNAMMLLAKLKDEKTITVFCNQIQDPNQHESVKFMAMEGLEALGQKKLITQVNLETLAVNTLLDVLAQPDEFHSFTRHQAAKALGAIGRPNRVVGGNDVDVALALLRIVRDPNVRRADRSETAELLANLQIPNQIDYNYQYVAYEIAKFAADVGAAAANDPAADDLHSDLYLVTASYVLTAEKRPDKTPLVERAKKNTHANTKTDPIYVRAVGDLVTKLTVAALKAYKPDVAGGTAKPAQAKDRAKMAGDELLKKAKEVQEKLQDPNGQFMVQLNALNDFLKSKAPRSMKLTPFSDELGPPPALAGSQSRETGEAGNGAASNEQLVERPGGADRADQ